MSEFLKRMRKIVFAILLIAAIPVFSQTPGKKPSNKAGIKERVLLSDSVMNKLKDFRDSIEKLQVNTGIHKVQVQTDKTAEYSRVLQQEQNEKKKKGAIIRIGIGLAMLALLIIGLRRRKK